MVSGGAIMHRALLLLSIDLCLIAFATVAAVAFRYNFEVSPEGVQSFLPYLGVTLSVAVPVLLALRPNRGIWRLSAKPDYLRVVAAALVTVLGAVALGFI